MPRRAASVRASEGKSTQLVPVVPLRDTVHFPGLVHTLHVARRLSLAALDQAADDQNLVLVLSQRDMSVDDPRATDLCRIGTLSEILQSLPLPGGTVRAVLRGHQRAHAVKVIRKQGCFWAEIQRIEEPEAYSLESIGLMRECVQAFEAIVQNGKDIPPEAMDAVAHLDSPGALADAIMHHLPVPPTEKQGLLEELNPEERIARVYELLLREQRVLEFRSELRTTTDQRILESQRSFFLREQMQAIQRELAEIEGLRDEPAEYRERIEAAELPQEARDKAMSELRRLERASDSTPEAAVSRAYLDHLLSLPWSERTPDSADVSAAAEVLEEGHYGLDQIKERILEYLSVRQLTRSIRGPILCFVGPPGVGKTSVAKAIAEALGRRFVSASLGGLRDEADIRGHRRTYVGAMPGRLLHGLAQCGAKNPVFMLDEIDKLGSDYRGDPSSALLEALDPQQNTRFRDHYIELPFDLSEVLFIATANVLDTIPPALRDRLEIIRFTGYSDQEKLQIAKRFIVPRMLAEHGLSEQVLEIPEEALSTIIREYTRESGVRLLEKCVASLCRKAAREVATSHSRQPLKVDADLLGKWLGPEPFPMTAAKQPSLLGSVRVLVVSEYGGEVLSVEAAALQPVALEPTLKLTGNLGAVMKESAEAALTFLRSIELDRSSRMAHDIHVHVPEGGIPKDGPSAGVAVAVAIASAVSGRPVRQDVAVTGEITLRGKVIAIGGMREKLLAAQRAGIAEVLIPEDNLKEAQALPAHVTEGMKITPIHSAVQALEAMLEPPVSRTAPAAVKTDR